MLSINGNGGNFSPFQHRLSKDALRNYIVPRFLVSPGEEEQEVERFSYQHLLDRIAACSPQTWFVEGLAGSGKSSLTVHIAIDCLKRDVACVFVDRISLSHGIDTNIDLKDFAKAARHADDNEKLWKARIKQGKCVFIVDAVNELRREFHNTPQWQFVRRVLESGHRYPVLATSRYEHEGEETLSRYWNQLILAPLDREEVFDYLAARGFEAAHALDEIEAAGLDGLSWNPFFLSLCADFLQYREGKDQIKLPRCRAELFRATVNRPKDKRRLTLTEEELRLPVFRRHGLTLEAVLCASSITAFLTKRQGAEELKLSDLLSLLERVWGKDSGISRMVNAFLDTQMVKRITGQSSVEYYRLFHPSLVDFGLALGWRNQLPGVMARDSSFLEQYLGNWVGLQENPDDAVQKILASENDFLPMGSILIDVLLANHGILREETQKELWQTIGKGFFLARPIRDHLARSLAKLPLSIIRNGTKHGLFRGLRRENPLLANKVEDALREGWLGPRSLQNLRRKNQRDATGTGRIGDPAAVPALTAALRDPTNAPKVRGFAATALGRIGDRAAVKALANVLQDKTGTLTNTPWVRGSAANALGQIGDRAAVPALANALADKTNTHEVRGSAANALGQIGDPAAVEALTTALTDKTNESNVRGSAATALGQIGDSAAVEALTTALTDKTNESDVRGSAANALGQIGDPAAVEALAKALTDTTNTPWVRGSAANALGRIGDPAAVEALANALADKTNTHALRGSAANALGLIGDSAAVPALANTLTDKTNESGVRGSAANALGQIGDPAAVEALTTALIDKTNESKVRGSAANALGRIGDRAAVKALANVLQDKADTLTNTPWVRGSAATALGQIGDPAAVPALTNTLTDKTNESGVRGSAASALGRIGDRAAVPALTNALTDKTNTHDVRGSAANALGRIGDPSASQSLIACIEDDEAPFDVISSAVAAWSALSVADPAEWLMPIADCAKTYFGDDKKDAERFRGTIVNVLSRNISSEKEHDKEKCEWITKVAQYDPNYINRTSAVSGLAQARRINERLIRVLIDPDIKRRNKTPHRDTDNGVCGQACAAVISMAAYDKPLAERLIPVVLSLLARPDTDSSVTKAAFAPLNSLSLDDAAWAMRIIEEEFSRMVKPGAYLSRGIALHKKLLGRRQEAEAEYQALHDKPEDMLMTFAKEAISQFEPRQEPKREDKYDVGLLTAKSIEAAAVYDELRSQGIATRRVQENGRYYDAFQLEGPECPVRVIFGLATDKNGQPAAAVTRDMIAEFHPDLILLVGVAGGLRKVKLYDLIIARNVINYDPERIEESQKGQRPQSYRTDEQLLRLTSYLETRHKLDDILDGAEIHQKDYVSGEKVIAWREASLRKQLLDLSIDVYGVETEAHGVMHAIWETFKAVKYVGGGMIKCVSDLGDEDMGTDKDEKQKRAATKAARVALAIIRHFHRN